MNQITVVDRMAVIGWRLIEDLRRCSQLRVNVTLYPNVNVGTQFKGNACPSYVGALMEASMCAALALDEFGRSAEFHADICSALQLDCSAAGLTDYKVSHLHLSRQELANLAGVVWPRLLARHAERLICVQV